ncbi:signal peptidase II [Candidatus Woesearchaeota archaeon]|nr:signal peptidase II [Candidatus Woesearchaeota archaeon]
MNKLGFLIVSILIIISDQISKFYFTNKNVIITKFLSFRYAENTGAAFSILQNQRLFLILISIIVFFVFLYYFKKTDKLVLTGISFLFGGIVGNLIDRLYFGYVRDFIDFKIWPVFNVADSFNTLGVILIVYYLIYLEKN